MQIKLAPVAIFLCQVCKGKHFNPSRHMVTGQDHLDPLLSPKSNPQKGSNRNSFSSGRKSPKTLELSGYGLVKNTKYRMQYVHTRLEFHCRVLYGDCYVREV